MWQPFQIITAIIRVQNLLGVIEWRKSHSIDFGRQADLREADHNRKNEWMGGHARLPQLENENYLLVVTQQRNQPVDRGRESNTTVACNSDFIDTHSLISPCKVIPRLQAVASPTGERKLKTKQTARTVLNLNLWPCRITQSFHI